MEKKQNLKDKMRHKETESFTISVCNPSYMEMAKQIQIGVLRKEDNDERNKKRKKKA